MADTHPLSWAQLPWLGFDTETTGVNPRRDRLVSAALVLRSKGASGSPDSDTITTWLADPGVDIPDTAAQIHGITTQHARSHGRAIEEVLNEVASALAAHMTQGYPVVAFNGSYAVTRFQHSATDLEPQNRHRSSTPWSWTAILSASAKERSNCH